MEEAVNFTPFADRVLMKQLEKEEAQPSGGIIVPDSQKERPLEGMVVAAGRGRWERGNLVMPEAHVGDTVLFGRYAGTEIRVDGELYLLLRDEEVMGRRPAAAERS